MKTRILLFAVLLIIFLGGMAASAPEKNHSEISLQEVLSIGGMEEDILFQWVGVTTDEKASIFVTDAIDYSLKKFDAGGNFLYKAGRKGRGPGEFLAPRLIDCQGERIYVTDQYIPGIQVFDRALNFLKNISLSVPVSDIKILAEGTIAVSTLSDGDRGRIYFFNEMGERLREFTYADRESAPLMNLVNFDIDLHGNLYLAYNFKDKVEMFEAGGRKKWSKNILKIKRIEKKKIALWEVPAEIVYKDVALDSSGRIYVLGGNYSQHPSQDIYILNQNGEHLTTLTLQDPSHCIYIDRKDFLYARADDGVTLKKYRIVEKDRI